MVLSGVRGCWAGAVVTLGLAVLGRAQYTSQWAAHIHGGPLVAAEIAQKHGFSLIAQIFPDYYHLEHRKVAKRSLRPNTEHNDNLLSEKQVKWAKQQRVRKRKKRDYLTRKDLGVSSESHVYLNDPRWPHMWYLNRGHGLDMRVEGAWKLGVTGKGIVVTILDDGLETDHPDIEKNYDPQASYDVNGNDENPMPRYDLIDSNRHGTRCAGEVAAVANNSLCSVGIAFRANIGGVRMLDGEVTDVVEARSLGLNPQHIDIYSASWGPDDDGKTVDGPGELAMLAFQHGVERGRSGKGSIFVWASGNGGRDHDDCNCDGYTNSIWTLSISSATEKGNVPWYSEACSSTLATTYSSGTTVEKQIITTDLHHLCTSSHTGTSASAPLAAGICALALEANTMLTWRDMQHIVVETAKPANLQAADWAVNGVGRNVSHSFGYGLMDAEAMVRLAKSWRTVPKQHKCEVSAPHSDKVIPAKSSVQLQLPVRECARVNYLEHVQAKISLSSPRRGDIEIQLVSPAGTRATLLAKRPHDFSRAGFRSWPFMSVHTWGEHPLGNWTLEIHNTGRLLGQLSDWSLIFYGTESPPGVEAPTEGSPKRPTTPPNPPLKEPSPPSSVGRWKEVMGKTGAGSGLPTSGCQTQTRSCLDCHSGFFLWQGSCETACPMTTFESGPGTCSRCHYSCLQCSGPNDYDCTMCHPDAIHVDTSTGTYCVLEVLSSDLLTTTWYFRIIVVLTFNALLIVASMFICYSRHIGCRLRKEKPSLSVIDKVSYKLTQNESDSDC